MSKKSRMVIKDKQSIDKILSFVRSDYKIFENNNIWQKIIYKLRKKKAISALKVILMERGFNPNLAWHIEYSEIDNDLICYINDKKYCMHISLDDISEIKKDIIFKKETNSDIYRYSIIKENIKLLKKVKSEIILENGNKMEIEYDTDFNIIYYTFGNNDKLKIVLDKQHFDENIIKDFLENLELPTNILTIYQKLKELIIIPSLFIKGISLNDDYIIWKDAKIIGVNITRYGHNISFKNDNWFYQGPLVKANYTQDNFALQSLNFLDSTCSSDDIASDIIKSIDVIKKVRKKIEEEC